ncbi:twin-arginine translocation signal domain-containing protein [Chloroflexota bacterium]
MTTENLIDRRNFLKRAGLAAGLTAATGMMITCGAEEESAAPTVWRLSG